MALPAQNLASLPSVHLPCPEGLTADQATVWHETVHSRSSDYFGPESVPLLAEYCRVVVMCDVLDEKVQAAIAVGEPAVIKAFLDMRDKESRRMTSIATKLRLTNQSRYTHKTAGTAANKGAGGKVWQFGQKTGA